MTLYVGGTAKQLRPIGLINLVDGLDIEDGVGAVGRARIVKLASFWFSDGDGDRRIQPEDELNPCGRQSRSCPVAADRRL